MIVIELHVHALNSMLLFDLPFSSEEAQSISRPEARCKLLLGLHASLIEHFSCLTRNMNVVNLVVVETETTGMATLCLKTEFRHDARSGAPRRVLEPIIR